MKRRSLALVLSMALALLLGVGSLAGSTVAWFTDSITSLNSIQSGTLDVEMNYRYPGEAAWKSVELNTPLFEQDKLHVPGCIQTVFLQAENVSTLALKYQLGITAANTVIGKNEAGEDIRLTDYLEVGAWLVDGKIITEASFKDRAAVQEMLTADEALSAEEQHMHKLKDFAAPEFESANSTDKAVILLTNRDLEAAPADTDAAPAAAKNTETIALVLHLPIDVDNVANYRGTERPQIAIGVHLLAGQAMVETDAFGKEYDQLAESPAYSDPLKLAEEAAAMPTAAATADEGANASTGPQHSENENFGAEPAGGNTQAPVGNL